MAGCNGCGACCDPVAAPWSLDTLRRIGPWVLPDLPADFAADREFALEHLHPIPRSEGLAAAPYMSTGMSMLRRPDGSLDWLVTHFYRCDLFDPVERTCTAYDDRPPMCRNYPWYGDPPDPSKVLPDQCGYLTDVGRTPVPVTITTKEQ